MIWKAEISRTTEVYSGGWRPCSLSEYPVARVNWTGWLGPFSGDSSEFVGFARVCPELQARFYLGD